MNAYFDRRLIGEGYGLAGTQVVPLLQPVLQRFIVELRQSLRFGLNDNDRANLSLFITGPGSAVKGLSVDSGAVDHAAADGGAVDHAAADGGAVDHAAADGRAVKGWAVQGGAVKGWVYLPVPEHPTYAPDLPEARIVELISAGVGQSGTARNYLRELLAELKRMGIEEPSLRNILEQVERVGPEPPPRAAQPS